VSKKADLCYLPTSRLCSLNDALEDSHFPDNKHNVFRQETVTYEYVDNGIKVTTFVRNFSGDTHFDSTTSQIIVNKEDWNAPTQAKRPPTS